MNLQARDLDFREIRIALRQRGRVELVLSQEQASVARYLLDQVSKLNDHFSLFAGLSAIAGFLRHIKHVWLLHKRYSRLAELEAIYLEEKGLSYRFEPRADGEVVLWLATRPRQR